MFKPASKSSSCSPLSHCPLSAEGLSLWQGVPALLGQLNQTFWGHLSHPETTHKWSLTLLLFPWHLNLCFGSHGTQQRSNQCVYKILVCTKSRRQRQPLCWTWHWETNLFKLLSSNNPHRKLRSTVNTLESNVEPTWIIQCALQKWNQESK